MDATVEWATKGQIPEGLVRVIGPCHWCGKVYERDLETEYVVASLNYGICEPCVEAEGDAA